jgi:hypothetical protein
MAAVNEWTKIGPDSKQVSMLAVDPVNPSIIYLMTELTGVQSGFKSTNGGTSWGSFTLPAVGVVGFAIDPPNHETLYAGLSRYVYKSINSGGAWTGIYTAPANYFFNIFAIDPLNSNTIYAGTTFSPWVLKSIDGGFNWNTANSGMTGGSPKVIALDPANHATLYVGSNNGIFKSIDSAATWNPINSGLPSSNGPYSTAINAIAINPLNSSTIYAGTSAGLYKSSNGGDTWSASGTGLPTFNQSVAALAIDPLQPARLYAGTSSGIFRSTNAGTSWNAVNAGLTNTSIKTLAIDPQSPDNLYAGTDGGLFKITFQDTGQHFLTYTKNGAGHGVVTSNPPGIDCSESCAAQFDANTQVVLHMETYSNSFFMGWTGACTDTSSDCTISMDGDKAVAARFALGTEHMVMVQGGAFPQPYYSLQTGYNNVDSGNEIWAMGTEFVEDLTCDADKDVSLKGGYDSSFNASSGYTTMRGLLTVGMGTVTLADLIIY